jgi:hypothetical protein
MIIITIITIIITIIIIITAHQEWHGKSQLSQLTGPIQYSGSWLIWIWRSFPWTRYCVCWEVRTEVPPPPKKSSFF